MATVYAAETDCAFYSYKSGGDTWNLVRGDTAGGVTHIPFHSGGNASLYYYAYVKKYNATKFLLVRAILAFDVSGITAAPSAATLKVWGGSNHTGEDIVVVKVDAGATISLADDAVSGDFEKITGFSANNSMAGNVTDYSAVPVSPPGGGWVNSAYNDIPLSSTCLADMASLDVLKLMVVQYDNDYLDVIPGDTNGHNALYAYYQDQTGTSKDPYIDYVPGASGWGGAIAGKGKKLGSTAGGDTKTILGVSSANTAKILGIE